MCECVYMVIILRTMTLIGVVCDTSMLIGIAVDDVSRDKHNMTIELSCHGTGMLITDIIII